MLKKLLLIASVTAAVTVSNAQTSTNSSELNCYNKWSAKFEERGADAVEDGVYEDVIITSRTGSNAKCYSGKAEVKANKVIRFYITLDDGSYEEVKRSWKNAANKDVPIVNGISKTMITTRSELINVLFPKKIKAKKAAPKMAPDPTDD